MSQSDDQPFNVDLSDGAEPPKGFVRGKTVVLVCAALVVSLLAVDLVSNLVGRSRDHRMDSDRATLSSKTVTHSLIDTTTGVDERWVAVDADDAATTAAIRRATKELLITRRNVGDFAVGDRKDLTGREVIEAGLADITVERAEIDGGAQLTYSAADPELQQALQQWAAAQR